VLPGVVTTSVKKRLSNSALPSLCRQMTGLVWNPFARKNTIDGCGGETNLAA